jgi:hypothetical protein
MTSLLHKPLRWANLLVLIIGLVVALSGCATGPRPVLHSFSFNGQKDGWAESIDLLAYSYGDQYRMVRNDVANPRSPVFKDMSALPPASNVGGFIPVGEFLQVKWRIKATGEVLEDRVDLRGRLPADMNKRDVTFVIDGRQLYVFVITPTPITVNLPKPPKKSWISRHRVAYEIYPNNEMK